MVQTAGADAKACKEGAGVSRTVTKMFIDGGA